MNWLALLWQIPIGLIVLSFLVLIHELGHYLVARYTGTTVEVFSIGFGPTLWEFKRNGIKYRISAVPFGGYVAMPGEDIASLENTDGREDTSAPKTDVEAPAEEKPADPNTFDKKPIRVRAAIAFAGPFVNIIFAFLAIWVLSMVGVMEPLHPHPVVSGLDSTAAGFRAGMQIGDTIMDIEGTSMHKPEQVIERFALSRDKDVKVSVRRASGETELTVRPQSGPGKLADLGWAGVQLGGTVLAQQLVPSGAAAKSGVLAGDTILSVDGRPLSSASLLAPQVGAQNGAALTLQLGRPAGRQTLAIKPTWNGGEKRWMLGIMAADAVPMELHRYGPIEAVNRANRECISYAFSIFRTFKALATRSVSPKNLAGPVGIMQMAGRAAHNGLQSFLEFLALVSVNLGIINLLPLVITDGGQLFALAWEALRGKPVSPKFMNHLTNVFFWLFVALALYVTFQDILRVPMFLK